MYRNLGGGKTKVEMEREKLQEKYIRFGLNIESGGVIWIVDSDLDSRL